MNTEQRNAANNQTGNGGNEKPVSSSRSEAPGNDTAQGSQLHDSNDVAGGLPKSPGGHHLAADQKMDDDTGLSNTANRQPPIDPASRQAEQSNVGRRDDLTPD